MAEQQCDAISPIVAKSNLAAQLPVAARIALEQLASGAATIASLEPQLAGQLEATCCCCCCSCSYLLPAACCPLPVRVQAAVLILRIRMDPLPRMERPFVMLQSLLNFHIPTNISLRKDNLSFEELKWLNGRPTGQLLAVQFDSKLPLQTTPN